MLPQVNHNSRLLTSKISLVPVSVLNWRGFLIYHRGLGSPLHHRLPTGPPISNILKGKDSKGGLPLVRTVSRDSSVSWSRLSPNFNKVKYTSGIAITVNENIIVHIVPLNDHDSIIGYQPTITITLILVGDLISCDCIGNFIVYLFMGSRLVENEIDS